MVSQYNAADVAAHIVNVAIDMRHPVTNLQLQKMLFFCQCKSLQEMGDALFSDDIVAWQYGPVVRSVYHAYSYRGASAIRRAARYTESFVRNERTPIKKLDADSAKLAEGIVGEWAGKPTWAIVSKTHQPGGAWDTIYNADGVEGSGYGQVIPLELMKRERIS